MDVNVNELMLLLMLTISGKVWFPRLHVSSFLCIHQAQGCNKLKTLLCINHAVHLFFSLLLLAPFFDHIQHPNTFFLASLILATHSIVFLFSFSFTLSSLLIIMSLCTATEDDLSPPATPPSSSSSTSTTTSHDNDHHRCSSPPHHPRLYTSYVDLSMGGSPQKLMSRMDTSRLEYIWSVKDTFTQLNNKQQQLLLSELLLCCDNQLLAFVHSLIAPKLKIDFLRQLPIELSLHILQYVNDPYTLTRASQVSVFWNMLLKDESIWKRMCQRHLELQRRRQMSPHSTLPPLPISKATTSLSIRSFRHYYKRLYTIDGAWNKGGGKLTSCPNNIQSSLVTSLQVQDPFIVVGCDNHRIEVFDSITGNHVRTLTGHEGGVWALQFVKVSEQETILVSGGCDR